MRTVAYKRLVAILIAGCVGLLVLSGALVWKHGCLSLHVAFASDQTEIFNEMRSRAPKGDASEAARCLEYVISYYPSGTKQEKGSRLDRIVEGNRAAVVRDIISCLRSKTGEDLGDVPAPWIQKYGSR